MAGEILNFGSMNIDHLYRVPHFVRPGETLPSHSYEKKSGGKGFNQSLALVRAGAQVAHAGRVGRDGAFLKEALADAGVNVAAVEEVDMPTGHAIIQVNASGENSIVLFGGANQSYARTDVRAIIAARPAGSILLLQNELSCTKDIIEVGLEHGLKIAFNPAPMTRDVAALRLEELHLLVVNADEARALCGTPDASVERVLATLHKRCPHTPLVITAGAAGAYYVDSSENLHQAAERVEVVDTTGAGDTFVGWFLARRSLGASPSEALRVACGAAGDCVTRPGAQ